MSDQTMKPRKATGKPSYRSSWLFIIIGLFILLFSWLSWQFEIRPRLAHEALTNLQILADSRAKSIEAQLQNVTRNQDLSVIHNALNEMLLLIDPISGDHLFEGVSLEIDIEALPLESGAYLLQAGITRCTDCIVNESPVYNRDNGELIGIVKIYANPLLYQRLIYDIAIKLAAVLFGVLLVIILAWLVTTRLLQQLHERERNLTREIAERKQVEEKLHQIATYDQLTNLPNRYLLHSEFERKLEEAQRYEMKLAVLFLDIDHFKTINDMYGHEIGDVLLKKVSERIANVLRSYDLLSRFGGDEFVLIMSHLKSPSEVYSVVEKIISSVSRPLDLGEVQVQVTTSIGISFYPDDGSTPSSLLKNADLAMYIAKSEGRNGYHFFTQKMNQELERSQWIESELRSALQYDQLVIQLQPQQGFDQAEVKSCEALLRWPQGDGSFIDPAEFIPIAERTGLINELSNWVFDKLLQLQEQWRKLGYPTIRIDMNLSGKDFARNEVISRILELLAQDPRLPEKIGIEITENILLKSSNQIIDVLNQLHRAGIHISIDDFGTGYSSLNYLKQFPVSCLKIDQTFVRDAPNTTQDQSIMQAIVSVGHSLGLSVIAEGVESRLHYRLCKEIGCDTVQGMHISPPLSLEAFESSYLADDTANHSLRR